MFWVPFLGLGTLNGSATRLFGDCYRVGAASGFRLCMLCKAYEVLGAGVQGLGV